MEDTLVGHISWKDKLHPLWLLTDITSPNILNFDKSPLQNTRFSTALTSQLYPSYVRPATFWIFSLFFRIALSSYEAFIVSYQWLGGVPVCFPKLGHQYVPLLSISHLKHRYEIHLGSSIKLEFVLSDSFCRAQIFILKLSLIEVSSSVFFFFY